MRTLISAALLALLVGCGPGSDDDSGNPAANEGPLQYAPVAQWESYQFEDFPVRQYIPPDPIGLVFFFHGTNGNVTIVNQIEPVAYLNEMILAGFGFVSTESMDRQNGKWVDADVERVGRLYQHVLDTTEVEPKDALFTAGFSGGGTMAGKTAKYARDQGWPIKAINPNQSGCFECSGDIPAIWILNENDFQNHDTAQSAHADLVDANVHTALHWIYEEPMTAESFTKHPDMTPERSKQVFDDLVAKELVAADGTRLVPVDEAENWCNWYANNGECFGPEGRAEELRVIWAIHRMSADYARTTRDFFLSEM